jgi:peroxiredoxin (alkyl hydroperoxide reductase subunit C)
MSLINTKILPFTARAYQDSDFITVSNKDLLGQWSIVFFYPADFTFVCPTELSDVEDFYDELRELDVEVYAVSTDTVFTHKAWHDSSEAVGKVRYLMVGDPAHVLAQNFDVLRESEGTTDRATFIIDPDGTIQAITLTAEGIGRNAAELVRLVRAAQFIRENPGAVCPAKWVTGAPVLTPDRTSSVRSDQRPLPPPIPKCLVTVFAL